VTRRGVGIGVGGRSGSGWRSDMGFSRGRRSPWLLSDMVADVSLSGIGGTGTGRSTQHGIVGGMNKDAESPSDQPEHSWIVVADSGFLPPRGGGEQEHLGFVRAVYRAGWLALLVVPTDKELDLDAYTKVIGRTPLVPTTRRMSLLRLAHPRYPYVVASRPYPRHLADRIRALAPHATGVVTFSYKSRLIGEKIATGLSLPMVLRQHNREGEYHRSLASGMHGPRKLVMTWEAWRIERDERNFDRSPAVTAVADISADDAAKRRAAGARRVLHVPPFAFDPDLAAGSIAARGRGTESRVLFLGALDVVTNQSALEWFTTQVWPLVLGELPTAVLDVVGSRPSAELRRQVGDVPNTELHADVPDVSPYLERAGVAVNPAVTGSGVNIKLVEYLQSGVPVVSTALATRGLDLRAGVDLEVHDEPVGFAAAVVAMLRDPERAARVASSGRDRVSELLNPSRNLDLMAKAFAARAGAGAASTEN